MISSGGAQRQRLALEAEGVEVTVGRTGELRVSFQEYGWFPDSVVRDGSEDELIEEDE